MKKRIINHNPYLIFYLASCCFVVSHSLVSFRCVSDQSNALLQFKQEFEINESYSSSDASRPKNVVMATWNGSTDCCFWCGVRCDTSSGHVLGLDLSNSGLQGQLCANSSLFSLDQLQQLNLASNNFSYSQIPSTFGQLSRLTHLNLSDSVFSGHIPPELLLLINLESLDLSGNYYIFPGKLEIKSLVQDMPNLRQLHLDWVEFNSSVPESLTNLSSLTSLSLSRCRLRGEFPRNIFQLPNIRAIDVSDNDELTVSLPQYGSGISLRLLDISSTNSSGQLSDSIGYLSGLEVLDLGFCFLSGAVPSWMWNLSQLTYLDLSNNYLDGQLPMSLGENLAKLTLFELGFNKFSGQIPSSIGNLRRLEILGLSGNLFRGELPKSLANLSRLLSLDLSGNQFSGPIHSNMFQYFDSMITLDLSRNSFSGVIPSSVFKLPCLVSLLLNDNQFIGRFDTNNISSSRLELLNLRRNNLNGQIPISIYKLANLTGLFLRSNNLTGNIELSSFSELSALDVSNNGFSGTLPKCFGNSLLLLDLGANNFHGSIPEICTDECNLRVLKLRYNKLQGKFPQSLAKCRQLRVLDVGHNQIVDTFPFSLFALPKLTVLSLRCNKFHGPIWNPSTFWGFLELRVLDVSSNELNGEIPMDYFRNWNAIHGESDRNQWLYFTAVDSYYKYRYNPVALAGGYFDVLQGEVIESISAIDLSNNRFRGKIPDGIGDIQFLVVLNLSSNGFASLIPLSLGSLTQLEALDLSRNKLSGTIPDQLTYLDFLSYLNLSENQLTGQVPKRRQFQTFDTSSFEGNLGLCGPPLSNECDEFGKPPTSITGEDQGFDWKSIVMGYGCGLVIGLVAGHIISSKRLDCFVETLAGHIRSHLRLGNERGHTTCRLISKRRRAR